MIGCLVLGCLTHSRKLHKISAHWERATLCRFTLPKTCFTLLQSRTPSSYGGRGFLVTIKNTLTVTRKENSPPHNDLSLPLWTIIRNNLFQNVRSCLCTLHTTCAWNIVASNKNTLHGQYQWYADTNGSISEPVFFFFKYEDTTNYPA